MSTSTGALLDAALQGQLPTDRDALTLATETDTRKLANVAAQLRDRGFGNLVTYSRKVFIPLTHLCRDVCHYCTFAQTPKRIGAPYMTIEQVLDVARQGKALGCKEALFTLGEKPELRYKAAREALAQMGYATTLEYLHAAAKAVLDETGLLPHANPGTMTDEELALLRQVSPSMGIMLETASPRLSEKGMPHYGSPDKIPEVRLDTLRRAGAARVPFTSGILIGIGETRLERIESLLALRAVHAEHGHIQEIIVQNFRAKEGTKMRHAPEPDLDELLWTIAVARIVFGPDMSIQAPPNLSPGVLPQIVAAGINDWGGVSPLTPDFVNPEAPWPHLEELGRETARAGKLLHERLTIYPKYVQRPDVVARRTAAPHSARPGRRIGAAAHRRLVAGRNDESARRRARRDPRPECGGVRRSREDHRTRAARRGSDRTRSRHACSTRAATTSRRSFTRPMRSGSASTATSSATSSIATSTTRTSATSNASSARSRRASCPRTCAAARTICRSTRSSAARAKAGIAAPPKCACRAASIRTTPAIPTSRF